jgi:hypothetical protein
MKTLLRLTLVVVFVTSISFGAESDWRVGVASVKITPDKPVQMAGYASRVKPFERVEQDLFAKALAFQDSAGQRAVIVTTDLVGIPPSVLEPACERIKEKIGLRREQLLINWSHTHSGPTLRAKVEPVLGVPPQDVENTVAYSRWLQDRLVELVAEALAKLEPARLSYGWGVQNFTMNRREVTPTGIILGVNPSGPVDRRVQVLRVDAPDGSLRAMLVGCACHNTTLTDKNMLLAGDYAGYAQAFVEKKFPGKLALFMQGCGGDANPYPRGTLELARQHGEELGAEVSRVLSTKLKPVAGPLKLAYDFAELPLRSPPREELEKLAEKSPSWQIGNARAMLGALQRGEKLPTHHRAPVAVWQFGNDLTLVALSGEVVVDYVALIERALGPLQLWVAGYSNESFGYFPSARVVREGGYETRGLNSGGGWFAQEAEAALMAKVRELAARVGRKSLE